MSGVLDVILKTLVEAGPEGWPAAVHLPSAPVEVIDADTATLGGAADKVLRVAADPPYLLHLDFFAGHDTARAAKRLRRYNAILDERHDLIVHSVAVLLHRGADSPQLSGELVRAYPGQEPHVRFRYGVMRVWQEPAAAFLNSSPGLIPLAPVADVSERDLPAVIDELKGRLSQRRVRPIAGELWTATFFLLGMKYSTDLATQLLRGITMLEQSTTYQYIVEQGRRIGREEGREEGLEEGRAEGALKAKKQSLLLIGRKLLGPADDTAVAAVNAITDQGRLDQLLDRVPDVSSWAELLARPKRRRRPTSGG